MRNDVKKKKVICYTLPFVKGILHCKQKGKAIGLCCSQKKQGLLDQGRC